MKFADMSWKMMEDYLKHEDRVMVVLGATEQHSSLSLETDRLIPEQLAEAASKESGIVIAPALPYGVSSSFMSYPGTLTLRVRTYLSLIEDLTRALYAHGFRRMLFLNGHGGNAPARAVLGELVNELPDLKVSWYQWWTSKSVTDFSAAHNLPNMHANWEENFRFTRLGNAPKKGKPCLASSARVFNKEETKTRAADGSYGGPWQVDDAIMDEMFEICKAEILEILKFE